MKHLFLATIIALCASLSLSAQSADVPEESTEAPAEAPAVATLGAPELIAMASLLYTTDAADE